LRRVIAEKIEYLYGTQLDWENEITVTAGATQALFNAFTTFVHPGDEVIILDPAYDCYAPAVALSGGKAIHVPISGPDFRIPWDRVENAISSRTSLIVVTNPHNPLGKIMRKDDIEGMHDLLGKFQGHFLVDEVYEHLTYDNRKHLSIVSYPKLFDRSVVTYSFGKTFHNTGWKMGYSLAPRDLTTELRKVHQFNVFSVNTPIQHALADYMQDRDTYMGLPDFFQEKRDFLVDALKESALKPLPCEGSYFMLADYSAVSQLNDVTFAEWLTKEHGVATIPLSPFYREAPGDKVVRICFAKKLSTLEKAAEKLKNVKPLA
jgi:methionine aminotransferase